MLPGVYVILFSLMYKVSIELVSQYHGEDVIAGVEVQAVTVTAGRVAGRLPVRGIGPHV